ncbi:hypothetical protein [Winogradskya humida]|uniref:Minor tail protein n=1 Tax=Winogradskya humida TaxID=113566 RepID=A0ABQ4A8A2_9ACTN|nr:hypothetical protein [Actinoplanes humidus]GIE26557.1 hypothetical protein Ahu01nite_096590 [Actinoplanes humidus]
MAGAIPEWIAYAGTLVGGGLGGALIQGAFDRSKTRLTGSQNSELQAVKLLHQRDVQDLDLEGQETRLRREHAHQRVMLAQAAHFEVRKQMAELARDVVLWREKELLTLYGDEVSMFPQHYNTIDAPNGVMGSPSLDDLLDWGKLLSELIELINEPPPATNRTARSQLEE